MTTQDQEEDELSPDAQREEEAAIHERGVAADDQAGKESKAKGLLKKVLLRELREREREEAPELEKSEDTKAREQAEREELRAKIIELAFLTAPPFNDRKRDRTRELIAEVMPQLERMDDAEISEEFIEDLIIVPGTEVLKFIDDHLDLIPKDHYENLCKKILFEEVEKIAEGAVLFLDKALPTLSPEAWNEFISKAVDYSVAEEIVSLLVKRLPDMDVTPVAKGRLLVELVKRDYDLNFIREHIGTTDEDYREKIVDLLVKKGFSLVEGEPVRKVDSSLALMEDMKRGFLLSQWREAYRTDLLAFDLADAATLQGAVDRMAEKMFGKPLDQLDPSEMRELLTDKTADEINTELLPQFEAEMEPSTFRLILQNYTKSYDRANRCMDALAKELYKQKLEDLSGDEFRELLGRDEEIKKWISQDRFKEFSEAFTQQLELLESDFNVMHARSIVEAQSMKELQIQQIESDFRIALEAMPAAVAGVADSMETVREEMTRKIRTKYDTYMKELAQRVTQEKTHVQGLAQAELKSYASLIEKGEAFIRGASEQARKLNDASTHASIARGVGQSLPHEYGRKEYVTYGYVSAEEQFHNRIRREAAGKYFNSYSEDKRLHEIEREVAEGQI